MTLSKSARAGLAAAALTAGLTAAAGPGFAVAAVSKVQEVFITNDEASPVPTKAIGTTKVDATGQTLTINGKADVSGSSVDATGSKVSIDGEVPVRVTNQPAAASEQTPYQKRFFVDQLTDTHPALRGLINSEKLFKQPAGERLTITGVAGGGGGMHDALAYFRIMDWCQGEPANPVVLPVALPPVAEGVWPVFNAAVTLVIEPGHCVHVEARRQESPGDGITYPITLTGYTTKTG